MGDLDPGYSLTDNWYRGYDAYNSVLAVHQTSDTTQYCTELTRDDTEVDAKTVYVPCCLDSNRCFSSLHSFKQILFF